MRSRSLRSLHGSPNHFLVSPRYAHTITKVSSSLEPKPDVLPPKRSQQPLDRRPTRVRGVGYHPLCCAPCNHCCGEQRRRRWAERVLCAEHHRFLGESTPILVKQFTESPVYPRTDLFVRRARRRRMWSAPSGLSIVPRNYFQRFHMNYWIRNLLANGLPLARSSSGRFVLPL